METCQVHAYLRNAEKSASEMRMEVHQDGGWFNRVTCSATLELKVKVSHTICTA